jgi:hypothetical protein
MVVVEGLDGRRIARTKSFEEFRCLPLVMLKRSEKRQGFRMQLVL